MPETNTNLIRKTINYDRKKFYRIGAPGAVTFEEKGFVPIVTFGKNSLKLRFVMRLVE